MANAKRTAGVAQALGCLFASISFKQHDGGGGPHKELTPHTSDTFKTTNYQLLVYRSSDKRIYKLDIQDCPKNQR